jgi:hypothetical protein
LQSFSEMLVTGREERPISMSIPVEITVIQDRQPLLLRLIQLILLGLVVRSASELD